MNTPNEDRIRADFLAAQYEIIAMLARLQAHAENHFGAPSEGLTWGHVGDLQSLRRHLRGG